MPSAFKSRSEVGLLAQKENGIEAERGEFSYDENVFSRLKVAQDSLIEDLECKIVVSSVVNQAVLSGIVKALAGESSVMLAEKDEEIAALKKQRGEEQGMQLKKMAGEYLEKMKANELVVLEKERELCKMAESLVDLTFRLQGESLNNLALEKKMREVEARDGAKQKNINRLVEEIGTLKRERSEDIESLKRELRIKEVRYTEQLEETIAENEAQLAALRKENSKQLATIEVVNENVCQLMEAQKESMEAIEKLRVSLEEQKLQHDQEVEILVEVYEGQLHAMQEKLSMQNEEKLAHEAEVDILATYFTSLVSDQNCEDLKKQPEVDAVHQPEVEEGDSIITGALEELEREIILDCFSGFWEDLRLALDHFDLEAGRLSDALNQVRSGRKLSGDSRRYFWKSRSLQFQQKLIEQCYQHQTEMDVLMEFFVSKLRELEAMVMTPGTEVKPPRGGDAGGMLLTPGKSDASGMQLTPGKSDTGGMQLTRGKSDASGMQLTPGKSDAGGMQLAELHRENAKLRREKDQVLIDKTEEMFRLKRDFFKELDKQKMEGDEFLKRQFGDSRQKLERILEKKSSQRPGDDQSDSDSGSQSGDSMRTEYGKFNEQFPELVSDLQNEIERLMMDTGMAEESEGKSYGELQDDYDVLSLKYEEVVKALAEEKRRGNALTGDLQELEHNVELSNGELERLLRQVEVEKQARLQKEAELQTIKNDVILLRRQMEAVLSQLESERCLKKRMQSDSDSLQGQVELSGQRLESLQKELRDVLRVKGSISEELLRLRSEASVLRSSFQRAIEKQGAAMSEKLAKVKTSLEEKEARVRKVNDRLSKYAKLNRRKTSSFLLNLQRAEEEVDLLGDENDYLVSLLEKVFYALDRHSVVLQHYPGIAELSKLIRRELVSRIVA